MFVGERLEVGDALVDDLSVLQSSEQIFTVKANTHHQ